MNKKNLTLTIIANMHANYGESLGNIASIQKVYLNNKQYAIRTKESIKNAIMTQSGLYDDLKTVVDGATQKEVSENNTLEHSRALEGGYMTTTPNTLKRNSSISVSDAIAITPFNIETRFCNNLGMASNYAMLNGLNVNDDAKKTGLMPYQYENDMELKIYSVSIDLERIGVDENYEVNVPVEEKLYRINALLDAIENLSLLVKGNLDNAEPLFICGGLTNIKTHVFNNVIKCKDNKITITESLKEKLSKNECIVGILDGVFDNEFEIKKELNAVTTTKFFEIIKEQVKDNMK